MPTQLQVLPPKLQGPIKHIIEEENITNYSINVNEVEVKRSFLAVVREININGETKTGRKELTLFTKTVIENLNPDTHISPVPDIYKNEAFMYNEFFKVISRLQLEAKIPINKRFEFAESYVSTDVDTIILENLSVKGYLHTTQDIIPLNIAKQAIENLAKFHSFAFILKEKRPDFFEEKVKNMKQPYFYGQKSFIDFVNNFSNVSMKFLNPGQKERIEKFLPQTYDKYEKYTLDPTCTWTMVHGDFRASNVMAKFDGNGEASSVMIVDYQHSFYGCSIVDFLFFVFAGSDKEFRKNHMEYLKNVYHSSMKEFLKLFDMDIEMYYPRKEFERLYEEKLDYGLMIALWLLPIIFADKSDIPGVLHESVQKQIQDIVDDYIDWGYI